MYMYVGYCIDSNDKSKNLHVHAGNIYMYVHVATCNRLFEQYTYIYKSNYENTRQKQKKLMINSKNI